MKELIIILFQLELFHRAYRRKLLPTMEEKGCRKIRTDSSVYLDIVAWRYIFSSLSFYLPFSTFIGYRGVALNAIVKFQENVTHYAGRVHAQRRYLRNIAAHRMYEASRIDAIHLHLCLSSLLSLACRPLSRRMTTRLRILPVCSSFI